MTPGAQIQSLVEALVETGWRLWTAAHNNTPAARLLCRWMRAIAPGHFVLEISTTKAGLAMGRVGVLLAITSSHEYTIRTIDGRVYRWEDAEFVRIPRDAVDNRELSLLGEHASHIMQPLKRLDPTWWRKVSGGYDQQDGRARLVRLKNAAGTKVTGWALYVDGKCVGSWSSLRKAKEHAANRRSDAA